MPPKQSTSGAPRGRPPGSKNKTTTPRANKPSAKAKGKQRAQASASPEPGRRQGADVMEVSDDDENNEEQDGEEEEEEEEEDEEEDAVLGEISDDEEPEKTIPPDLLTRILHEFFEKDGTRITKDANNAVAKYMDVFVKEAIARAAAERDGGFLEVCADPLLRMAWVPGREAP